MWINPKTDWSENDYINFVDFNRIESNIVEISTMLASMQYIIPSLTSVTNRDNSSIDYITSINRIENNIEILRDNFLTPPGYQNAKTWAIGMGFSYLDAIRFERNLQLLYEWIEKVKDGLKYCGTFYCGQDNTCL